MTTTKNAAGVSHITLAFRNEDNDNCRVYFRSDNNSLFCYQLERRGEFQLFECTRDGEPLAPIDINSVDISLKSTAPGKVKIGKEFLEWHEAMTSEPPSPSM